MKAKNLYILFKPRQNKTFNYQSAFSKEKESDTNLEDSKSKEFASKWKRNTARSRKVKGAMPIRTLAIVLVLLLICMYLLEKKFM